MASSILEKIKMQNEKKIDSINLKLTGDTKVLGDIKYILDNTKRVANGDATLVVSELIIKKCKGFFSQFANELREEDAKLKNKTVNKSSEVEEKNDEKEEM